MSTNLNQTNQEAFDKNLEKTSEEGPNLNDTTSSEEFSRKFYLSMKKRRTCRWFSDEPINLNVINNCILAASTAPSGGNSQPWFFSIITNQKIKSQIRYFAEETEKNFYFQKATDEFLEDLKPLGTHWQKSHLTEAPVLIVIFSKSFNLEQDIKKRCYYPKESTGIATGVLLTALHLVVLDTLTHTPNPMSFLNTILSRPIEEKPFLILAVGKKNVLYKPPVLSKKSLTEFSKIYS